MGEPPGERHTPQRWLAGGIALAAGVGLILLGQNVPAPLGKGSVAPDFRLPRAAGGEPIGLRDLRGQTVLVNFWATWCKPCEEEMPAMERLYRDFAGEPFELIAVSVDAETDEVLRFRERLGITFPIALDPDSTVSELYQTTGYPETLLLDAEGRVVERYVGPREWDSEPYVRRIRSLIGTPSS